MQTVYEVYGLRFIFGLMKIMNQFTFMYLKVL